MASGRVVGGKYLVFFKGMATGCLTLLQWVNGQHKSDLFIFFLWWVWVWGDHKLDPEDRQVSLVGCMMWNPNNQYTYYVRKIIVQCLSDMQEKVLCSYIHAQTYTLTRTCMHSHIKQEHNLNIRRNQKILYMITQGIGKTN